MTTPAAEAIPQRWHPRDPACQAEACAEAGWPCRRLPDGRFLHVIPMIFNVRLVVETPMSNRTGQYDDGWCYSKAHAFLALAALNTWDGGGDPPGPWIKRISDGAQGPGALGVCLRCGGRMVADGPLTMDAYCASGCGA